MLIGYARVSTKLQDSKLQRDALIKSGVDERNIYEDKISGIKDDRPKLQEALDYLQSGDMLVVWKLDRLGRSLPHLIKTVNLLEKKGVGFKSITENLDTSTPGGKLVFHIFGSMAQFERDLISERTIAGMKAASLRGNRAGRPKVLDSEQELLVKELNKEGKPIAMIARTLKVSRLTIYRTLERECKN